MKIDFNCRFRNSVTAWMFFILCCTSANQKEVSLVKISEIQVGDIDDYEINAGGSYLVVSEKGRIRIIKSFPPFDEISLNLDNSIIRVAFTYDEKHLLLQDTFGFTLLDSKNYEFIKRIQVDSTLLSKAEKIVAVSDTSIFITYREFEPISLSNRYDRLAYHQIYFYDVFRKNEWYLGDVNEHIVAYDIDDSCKTIAAILKTNKVILWDIPKKEKHLLRYKSSSIPTHIFLSDKARYLSILEINNSLSLWNINSMSEICTNDFGANRSITIDKENCVALMTKFGIMYRDKTNSVTDVLSYGGIAGSKIRISSEKQIFAVYSKTKKRIEMWSIGQSEH